MEILFGFIGLQGIGWLYSGGTLAGILWFVGVLIFDIVMYGLIALSAMQTVPAYDPVFGGYVTNNSGSLGACFCVYPVNLVLIAISTFLLSRFTKSHPDTFGASSPR